MTNKTSLKTLDYFDDPQKWDYLKNLKFPFIFILTDSGITQKNSFCLDGKSKPNDTETHRIAIRPFNSKLSSISKVKWTNYQNKYIRIVNSGDIYFFLKVSDDSRNIDSIICTYFRSFETELCWEGYDLKEKGIIEIKQILGKSLGNCLLCFKNEDGKELYYNPQRLIDTVKYSDEECDKLRDLSYKSPTYTITNEDLAPMFCRSPEEIANLRNKLATRSEFRAGTKDLSKYLNISEYFNQSSTENAIIGAITNSEHESGQVIKVGNSKQEVLSIIEVMNIFNMLGKDGVLSSDEITLLFELNETNVADIKSAKPNDKIKTFFSDNTFLTAFSKYLPKKSKLICKIAFEDISFGAGQFNSYFFVISDKQTVDNIWNNNKYYIMRYLLYLRSENENYYRNEKRKQAISSAVAAIMSRNMSHNLGSHYLYYTKAHLEEIARQAESFGPDIRGAAKVLGYIQGRMDYLATLISNDKYPYAPVNFMSQLFDDLTIDSSSKRHFGSGKVNERTTNFLLTNLILSENFTRPEITDNTEQSPFDLLRLQVKYQKDDGAPYQTFTGTNNDLFDVTPSMESETEIKNALSHLNIAMPGGTMSCHAFYNILENFIRNSAKYHREDFDTEERYIYDKVTASGKNVKYRNLNITIGIKKHSDGRFVDFFIYDNKANAARKKEKTEDHWLLSELNRKLCEIRILNDDNSINKENKGLKEMLFSAAWMRAYSFEKEKNYSDIITDIQSIPDGENKLHEINQHCFSFVAVKDSGDNIDVLKEKDIADNNIEPLNLGILFTLPVFLNTSILNNSNIDEDIINESLSLYADIAVTDEVTQQLSRIYTRLYCRENDEILHEQTNERDLKILKEVLQKRFPDINEYRLVFGTNSDKGKESTQDDNRTIKFQHHLNSQESSHLDDNLKFAYADSVSGGDFTKTLNELFDNGNPEIVNGSKNYSYKTPEDEYFALKIKESALTRITIIDERLSNNTQKRGNEYRLELTLKNLRVLNYIEHDKIDSILEMFEGNAFKDKKSDTHFLSIHLGIIEKILKSKGFNTYVSNKDKAVITLDQKAKFLMNSLREAFGDQETYITVHSGRGNFSKELEDSLNSYPFISLSSIESAFNNCKYLLSQLFYSTRYVGKGIYNKQS